MSKLTAIVVPISLAILSVRGSIVAFGVRGGSSLLRIFPLLFAYMSSTDRMTSRNCSGGMKSSDQYRSEEHTSELQSHSDIVCRLLLEKKKERNEQHLSQADKHRHYRRARLTT